SLTVIAKAQRVTLNIPNGHAKNIEQIAVTANGKYVASISYKTVMIWEVTSRKKIHEISLNISLTASQTNSLDITDDLSKVLACTNSGLFCYNIQTGKEIFSDGGITSGAAFSKDGNKIYAINYGTLDIIDAASGKKIKYITGAVNNTSADCKFYELDGNRLLVLHDYGWSIINMATDEIIFKKIFENIYSEKLDGYDYSEKGNMIIGFRDEYLISFDALTGTIKKKQTTAYGTHGFCINTNGEMVLFSRDYKAKLHKTELLNTNSFSVIKKTSQPDAEVPEEIFYANHCVPLPGTTKIIYNNDKQLYIYDFNEGSYSKAFPNKVADFKKYYFYSNLSDRLMPDNNFALATEEDGIRVFDMETFKPTTYTPIPPSAVWSSDGKLVAGIGKKITLTSRVTGKLIKTLPLPAGIDPEMNFFFFSYDNKSIIHTDNNQGSLNALNINTGIDTKLHSFGGSYSFSGESASFDGKYFACMVTVAGKENVQVLNLLTKQIIFNKRADIGAVSFLNDSYYLLGVGQKDDITIYNVEKPAYESNFQVAHLNQLKVLGGDIKNNIIALGEVGQYQVGTYNIKLITLEGKLIKEFLHENNNDFLKATFSKDDKIMFTPTTQKGVQVWNTESGELLGTYYFIEKTNEYIFVSPEGLFDGSVEGMKELYFVKNNKPIPLENLYEQFYTPDLLRRKINGEKFLPPDVANLHDAPKVKISYAAVQRNLEVSDDMPTYQNTTGAAEITVTANAADDAVDEIRLFQNGKILNLVTRNLIVADDKTTIAVKKYSISLLPGQNNIRAVALNTQRTESDPDEIAVIYNGTATNTNDTKPVVNNTDGAPVAAVDKNATMYLIVVGINDYQNKSMSLNYALADATSFKDEVEKDAKSIISNIKTYFVTDNAADKKGIENAFASVQKNAKPEDIFVFYYAGHGVIGKNNEFYLVPTDISDLKNVQTELEQKGISSKLLQQYAVDIAAQKQLFILDACQSAGAFSTLMTNDANQQKSIAVVARSTGTHWMAASGAQQFANEFASLGHGAFTYVLLEALKGAAS
ncbi:MAG: caspase family protein, partial [Panacibacter sp.]